MQGTSNICLVYGSNGPTSGIVGYTNFDYGEDLIRRRSLTCYIFTLYGCAISWKATLQSTIALSITEGKYMSLTEGMKESMWLYGLINSLSLNVQRPIIYCNSQNTVNLANNSIYHKKSKHIDVRLNFIRDIIEDQLFTIEKIATTNMLTKTLSAKKFKYSLDLVNVHIA